jgi:hypothetical protein
MATLTGAVREFILEDLLGCVGIYNQKNNTIWMCGKDGELKPECGMLPFFTSHDCALHLPLAFRSTWVVGFERPSMVFNHGRLNIWKISLKLKWMKWVVHLDEKIPLIVNIHTC